MGKQTAEATSGAIPQLETYVEPGYWVPGYVAGEVALGVAGLFSAEPIQGVGRVTIDISSLTYYSEAVPS